MKKAEIIAMKTPSGLVLSRWIGSSCFAEIGNGTGENKPVFEIGDLKLRVIGQTLSRNVYFYNTKIVMRESILARLIAFFFKNLLAVVEWFAPIEAKHCGIKDGAKFPKTTIVGFISEFLILPVFLRNNES